MNEPISERTSALWRRLVECRWAYSLASRDFLAEKAERIAVLRRALRSPERDTALAMSGSLSVEERQDLFSEWVHLARCAHSPFAPAWDIILALPREWVLARIEQEVDAILEKAEETDYWMFLQLYAKLDRNLTLKLARRAAVHADPEIRELGEDYLEQLLGTPSQPRNGAAGVPAPSQANPLSAAPANLTAVVPVRESDGP